MVALFILIMTVLNLYFWAIVISAVMSWLIAFNIINTQNKFVFAFLNFLNRITEPGLRPIRRVLPNLGGVDVSPIILILFIMFIQNLLKEYWPGL